MRIVQLVFHLGPGGAEKIVTDLSNELSAMGNDVTVIMLRNPEENNYGFNCKFLSPSVKLLHLDIREGFRAGDIRIVEKSILEEKPDIVHCHLNVIPYIWTLSLKNTGIRFFHTIHSIATFDIASAKERRIAGYFYKRTVRPVAISKICRDSFADEYGIEPDMIYNGRSVRTTEEGIAAVSGELSGMQRPIFVHVGRCSEEKNQSMLIEAAHILKRDGVPFSLLFIGGGYEESGLPQQNNDENIRFLGTKDNVADYLRNCDAFCLPSLVEGCPISLIEALSCGITPVCTPAGGIPDMISDGVTGYLSKDYSAEAFAEAMKRFMERPINAETLTGHYSENFSISGCAVEYMELFKTAAKPKVLFITPLPPPVHGSAMVSEAIRNSRMINGFFDCDFVNLSTSSKVSEIGKASLPKIIRFAKAFSRTFHMLLHNRYDLCYIALTCHGKGFLKDAPFALLCKLFGKKLVIHQHNKGMSEDVGKWPYKQLLKAVYKDSSVILLSWRLYDDISAIVSRDQVMVCPNGIKDTTDGRIERKAGSGPVRLLFLSNLIPSKGLPELLEACSLLKRKQMDFECHIVGKETEEYSRKKLEADIRDLGIEDKVFYDGCRYGKEKDVMFDSSDIFVFPTRYPNETFGLVILEAMQRGLPVIATEEGGIPDIVKDGKNGLVCRKNDPASLAEAIEKLISDPEVRMTMGAAGRIIFEEKFTHKIFESNFTNCLSKALKKP